MTAYLLEKRAGVARGGTHRELREGELLRTVSEAPRGQFRARGQAADAERVFHRTGTCEPSLQRRTKRRAARRPLSSERVGQQHAAVAAVGRRQRRRQRNQLIETVSVVDDTDPLRRLGPRN